MSFAAIGRAGLGQMEVLSGIVPGGGGTQYLLDRTGRNRALEIALGADLFDAQTAAISVGFFDRTTGTPAGDTFGSGGPVGPALGSVSPAAK